MSQKSESLVEELYSDLVKKGVFAKYKKQTHDAVILLSKAIKLRPTHYECYLQKGLTYFSVDQKNLAIQYIEEGYQKCQNTMTESQKHMLEGLLYELVEEDYKKALESYEKSVKLCSNDFAYNAIGYIYHIENKYKKAIEYYLKAVESKPKYSSCIMFCNIALCYEKLDEKNKALEYYGKSIACNPEYIEAYIYRSQYLAELKRYSLAKKDLRVVLSLDKLNSLATALLGDIYFDEGEEKKSYDQYVSASKIDPCVGSYYEILSSWQRHKFNNNVIAFNIIEKGLKNCLLDKEIHSLLKLKLKFFNAMKKSNDLTEKDKKEFEKTEKIFELIKHGQIPENYYKKRIKFNLVVHLKEIQPNFKRRLTNHYKRREIEQITNNVVIIFTKLWTKEEED